MLAKYFPIIRNVVSFFAKKVQFLPPKHASRCFSNEFSQHHWQESFDGDSFASQSRFDAYASVECGHGLGSETRNKYSMDVAIKDFIFP